MKSILSFYLMLTCLSNLTAQQSANDDEFNSAGTLAQWTNITSPSGYNAEHFQTLDINATTSGRLTLEPYTSAWFAHYRGGFIYKELTGDFVFTTEVNASTTQSSTYSLGGLFLRVPQSGSDVTNNVHDYIFLSTGYADPSHPSCSGACPAPHLEVKNTVNSNSNLRVAPVASGPVEIRIARLDNDIICLYRENGAGDFVVHERYIRNDFPNTIQAGFVAYTDWPKVQTYTPDFHNNNVLNSSLMPDPSSNGALPFAPDITATFDYARFDDVTVPTGLDPASASEQELLSFLGYEPDAALPVVWGGVDAIAIADDVVLEWTAHSLSDHDHFEVQHSRDGVGFENLGEVLVVAEVDEVYKYTHRTPGAGQHYYRILQRDLDGDTDISKVVMAAIRADAFILVPNPAQHEVRIKSSEPWIHAQLVDVQGQVVGQWQADISTLDLADIPAGLYTMVLTTEDGSKRHCKLIK